MNYILVENRTIIHLGPIAYRQRFIQSELIEHGIDYILPPTDPGYISLGNGFELMPAEEENFVHCDNWYQYQAGPFWRYEAEKAFYHYEVYDRPTLDIAKAEIKKRLAEVRYNKEIAGVKVTIQGVEVTVDTMRGERDVFVQKYLLMGENDLVWWKFPETWLELTKAQLGAAVLAGVTHIQDQFVWEAVMGASIDGATTKAELDTILGEINGAI